MKRLTFVVLTCLAAGALGAQSVPEIRFDATADFLKLPPNIYLGEVAGVAIDARTSSLRLQPHRRAQHGARRSRRRNSSSSGPTARSSARSARISTASPSRTPCASTRRQYLGDRRRHEHDHEVQPAGQSAHGARPARRGGGRSAAAPAPGAPAATRLGLVQSPDRRRVGSRRQRLHRRRLQQLARREGRQERTMGEDVGRARQRTRRSSTSCTRSPTTRRATSTSPTAPTVAFRCSIPTESSCASSRSTCRSRRTSNVMLGAMPPRTELRSHVSGAPWAICITPGPTQLLYSADAVPGRIYKLTLDGKVRRRARRGREAAQAVRLDPRDRVPVGERAVRRRAAQLARAEVDVASVASREPMSSKQRFYALYIDGKWVDSASRRWIDVMNPATQEIIARVPECRRRRRRRAVRAARRAFERARGRT